VDTRNKILTLAAARRLPPPVAIAAGYFDVLRAEHARQLQALKGQSRLLLAVLPLENALLDQRARAELAAALRVVDYVVPATREDLDALIQSLRPAAVARLEEDDARRRRQLIEHVQHR